MRQRYKERCMSETRFRFAKAFENLLEAGWSKSRGTVHFKSWRKLLKSAQDKLQGSSSKKLVPATFHNLQSQYSCHTSPCKNVKLFKLDTVIASFKK
jgi:hypothetical protein